VLRGLTLGQLRSIVRAKFACMIRYMIMIWIKVISGLTWPRFRTEAIYVTVHVMSCIPWHAWQLAAAATYPESTPLLGALNKVANLWGFGPFFNACIELRQNSRSCNL
jgi:hypothetical protein